METIYFVNYSDVQNRANGLKVCYTLRDAINCRDSYHFAYVIAQKGDELNPDKCENELHSMRCAFVDGKPDVCASEVAKIRQLTGVDLYSWSKLECSEHLRG